jgi:hypothetical protein
MARTQKNVATFPTFAIQRMRVGPTLISSAGIVKEKERCAARIKRAPQCRDIALPTTALGKPFWVIEQLGEARTGSRNLSNRWLSQK